MSMAALKWLPSLRIHNKNAKAVLYCMADMAGPDGGLFALQETIADRLDMPLRTLRRALAFLRNLGLVTVERGQRGCRFVLAVGASVAARRPVEPEPEPEAPEPEPEPEAPAPEQIGQCGLSDRPHWPIRSANVAAPSIDEPNSNPIEPRVPPSPPRGEGAEGKLLSFLNLYPRTGDRHATERAWRRALARGADPQDIVDGLEISLADGLLDPREGGRFAPPASQWLRGRRWLDFEEHMRRQMAPYAALNAARAAQAAQAGH